MRKLNNNKSKQQIIEEETPNPSSFLHNLEQNKIVFLVKEGKTKHLTKWNYFEKSD
jgi:hypothetical protein